MSFIAAYLLSFADNFLLRGLLVYPVAAAVIAHSILVVGNKGAIHKNSVLIVTISMAWAVWALLLNPRPVHPDIQVKAFLETLLVTITTVIILTKYQINGRVFIATLFLINAPFSGMQLLDGNVISGAHSNRNTFALMLVYISILSTYYGGMSLKSKATLFISVLLTQSTKGLAGLLIYGISRGASKAVLFFALAGVATLFFAEYVSAFSKAAQKISQLTTDLAGLDATNTNNDSALVRLYLIAQSIQLFVESPLGGYGINQAQYYIELPTAFVDRLETLNTQNNYSEVLVSAGLVGLVLYYAPLIYCMVQSALGRLDDSYVVAWLIATKLLMDTAAKSYNVPGTIIVYVFSLSMLLSRQKRV